MQTVTLVMQMSSDEALTTVVAALQEMCDVRVTAPPRAPYPQLLITVLNGDADLVDIVREITWEFDAQATQLDLFIEELDEVG